jgi:nucleoside-diphosphate-sugar epimerase
MKILVTGGTGFLGRRIVEKLLEREHLQGETVDLRCMVRDPARASVIETLAQRFPSARVELIQANLKHPAEVQAALADVDLVIHAAAALKGSPAEMFLDTVVAGRILLDAIVAMARRPRVVLVSSFGVMAVASLARGAVVDEDTPLETRPGERDVYSHAKLRQELLFREYAERFGLDLVVLRPGVIYGEGGGQMSNRVGLNLFGWFLHLGGNNLLPLTYVENCAEAIVVAALDPRAVGQVYCVVDDELPTAGEYLKLYRRKVKSMKTLRIPYGLLSWGSGLVERYHGRSKGQLPAIFTPYKTRAMWGGNRFSNARLKALGWEPRVRTADGLERSFASFRAEPPKTL